jgi:hypothetical protein
MDVELGDIIRYLVYNKLIFHNKVLTGSKDLISPSVFNYY